MYASSTCGFFDTIWYGPSAITAPRCRTLMVSAMLETTLVRICRPEQAQTLTNLEARVDALEKARSGS